MTMFQDPALYTPPTVRQHINKKRKRMNIKLLKVLAVIITLGIITSCVERKEEILSEIKSGKTGKNINISQKIDTSDLIDLSKEQLRFLRNEIFARRGYIFQSQDLNEYFLKFNWYEPKYTSNEIINYLSEIDQTNIEQIKQLETKLETKIINWKTEFQEYINLIPIIKLPLEFICEKGFETRPIDYNNEIIKKYKPEGAAIIGRLYQDNEEVGIIYGYPADVFFPVITRINKEGIEIESINVFELENCVGDAGYSAKTYGTITKNLEIKTRIIRYSWNYEIENSKKDSTVIEEIRTIRK